MKILNIVIRPAELCVVVGFLMVFLLKWDIHSRQGEQPGVPVFLVIGGALSVVLYFGRRAFLTQTSAGRFIGMAAGWGTIGFLHSVTLSIYVWKLDAWNAVVSGAWDGLLAAILAGTAQSLLTAWTRGPER